jgi:hypothetical protein
LRLKLGARCRSVADVSPGSLAAGGRAVRYRARRCGPGG